MNLALALVVAAVSGFIGLSYEILWYRVISFASWGLPGAFGLLLAAYLFGIAIGAKIAGAFCKDDARAGDPRQLRALAAFAFVANVVAWLVVPAFGFSAKRWDWPPALAFVVLAAALLGAILPLVSHFAIKPDDRAGANLSYVYLANIVGSAAGSLVTGFIFLDLWSIQTIGAVIASIGMVLVAALVALSGLSPRARRAGLAVLAVSSIVLVRTTPDAYDRIWERLLYKDKLTDRTRFADVIETKSGVITVTKDGTVYGGGAYDGRLNTSIMQDRNGIMRAFAVGALHPAPKRILMIGLASGSWAKVLSHLPGVEQMTIVEINPGYLSLIAKHPNVSSVLTDPKIDIVIDDGRRWLNRHAPEDGAVFDVIVMNTTFHWRAHATSLLSAEFMDIVRAHLRPGGILYFNATDSDDVQKTAATAFPYALRVYNCMATSDSPFTFDRSRWERTLADYAIDGVPAIDLTTPEGRAFYEGLVAYADTVQKPPIKEGLESRESVLRRTEASLVITDDNMVPEWREVLRFPEML
jgi:spermidine synthase